jgi:hypothetical protein
LLQQFVLFEVPTANLFLLFSELVQIHDETFEKTREWFSSMADDMRSKFENHYGDMPATESDYWDLPNGPAWHWWIIAILPLDPQAQVSCIIYWYYWEYSQTYVQRPPLEPEK